MERKTRRVLFLFCLAVFLLLGAGLTLYSFGYSLDQEHWTLVKTGSISLRANTSAGVYVNHQLAGTTSLISDAFAESRLLPRSYTIRVQKDGYFQWQKTVEVKAGFFIDFPRVVILPRELKPEPVASGSFTMPPPTDNKTIGNVPKLITSPDGDKAVWFTEHEVWVRWLKDASEQPLKRAGETELLTRYSGVISDVQWYGDSAHLIVSIGLPGQGGQLKFLETDPRGGLNSYNLAPAGDRFYYDRPSNRLYLQTGQLLSQIQLP